MARRNEEVARLLENIAKLLALKGENPFRVRAYTQAARNISAMSEDLEQLWHVGRLDDIPGVGPSIAGKVSEYLERGRSSYYEELKRQVQVAAADLLEVEHVGPARARLLATQLGITSIADLEQTDRAHKLRQRRAFGAAARAGALRGGHCAPWLGGAQERAQRAAAGAAAEPPGATASHLAGGMRKEKSMETELYYWTDRWERSFATLKDRAGHFRVEWGFRDPPGGDRHLQLGVHETSVREEAVQFLLERIGELAVEPDEAAMAEEHLRETLALHTR